MKKIISVMLAIMMLFGALSISASALTLKDYTDNLATDNSNVILVFEFNGGSSKGALPVFTPDLPNGSKFTLTDKVSGTYYMLPGAGGNELTIGSTVTMPSVFPPSDMDFVGWQCSIRDYELTAGSVLTLNERDIKSAHDNSYGLVYLRAHYEVGEPETDTMATVLGVLMKVFGTIAGLLFFDGSASAGITAIEGLLGGLL